MISCVKIETNNKQTNSFCSLSWGNAVDLTVATWNSWDQRTSSRDPTNVARVKRALKFWSMRARACYIDVERNVMSSCFPILTFPKYPIIRVDQRNRGNCDAIHLPAPKQPRFFNHLMVTFTKSQTKLKEKPKEIPESLDLASFLRHEWNWVTELRIIVAALF